MNSADCPAINKQCSSCKKLNHFSQSLNCKKTRNKNFKVKGYAVPGCMRLREFLKIKPLKLKGYSEAKSNLKSTPFKITKKLLKLIKNRIQLLEYESLQPDEPCESKLTFLEVFKLIGPTSKHIHYVLIVPKQSLGFLASFATL